MTISILTVCFNDREGLLNTIDSIKKQTYSDYEFVVMDGGSTDGCVDIIEQNKEIITYYESKCDGGVFWGMNDAIMHANGDYCIFMNSGDSFYDEYVLEKFINSVPTADIISGICCEYIGGKQHFWYPADEEDLSLRWFYRHALSHQATFIKTSLMKDLMYDTNYRIVSDWKFFMEAVLIKQCLYSTLDYIVCNYMDGGISRDAEKAFAERECAIIELFGKRILRDCHTMQYGVNEWDALSKKVNPKSFKGRIIYYLVSLLLKVKRKAYK